MFKPHNQSHNHQQQRNKSPYQPKLLSALMDSSDDDNDVQDNNNQYDFMSSHSNHHQLQNDQQENCGGQFINSSSNNNEEDEDQEINDNCTHTHTLRDIEHNNSIHTSVSRQTLKQTHSLDLIQTKSIKPSNNLLSYPTDNHHSKNSNHQPNPSNPSPLNLTRFTQSKLPKPSFNSKNSSSISSISHKNQSSHSHLNPINYQTLKLAQYTQQQIQKQQILYQQNLLHFKHHFQSEKPSQQSLLNDQPISQQHKPQTIDCIDSLEQMKSNLNRRHFSRKSLKNQLSTPSSRIKFLQQQKQPNSIQKQNHINLADDNTEIEKLRQELKRSKDVIKTLGLKNADLQKSLQMKNIKIQELQQEVNPIIKNDKRLRLKQQSENKVYGEINSYMKERVKEFMQEVKTVKMNPMLENSLQGFLAQILQLNPVMVKRKIGKDLVDLQKQEQREPLKQINQEITPNRLSKSIFNTKNELDQKYNIQRQQTTHNHHNQFKNRFQTSYPETHIAIATTNRQNAFVSAKGNNRVPNHDVKGYTVKLDLSSNKENITPNKVIQDNDNDLRQLEKSLQKLKAMEKQLSTPLPKNPFTTNKSHFLSNNQEYRSEYSIINRSHLSGFGKQQNSAVNMSSNILDKSNNLDRSKSRRKKIFAETNHK